MKEKVSGRINPVTLRIGNRDLEEDYRAASITDSLGQLRYAYILGILCYSVYSFVDYTSYNSVRDILMTVRLGVVLPVLFVGLICTFFDFYKSHAGPINLFVILVAGLGIILMVTFGVSEPTIGSMYGTMMLVMMFLYAFLKMPYLDAFGAGIVLTVGFLLVDWYILEPDKSVFMIHIFNLSAANLIGISTAYVMERHSKAEYLLQKSLSESVVKDALTDLYNRHYFDQFLVQEIEEFIHRSRGVKHIERRLGDVKAAKYGLLMLDIDYFKRVNDTFGHHSGDLVLQQFARILMDNVRRSDDVLRVGGEEFMLVMKLTTDDYLIQFMKKIGKAISDYDFRIEGGGIIGCTASIGLVIIPNPRTDDVSELVRYADRALYRSKDKGRNRAHRAYELQGELEFEEIFWD